MQLTDVTNFTGRLQVYEDGAVICAWFALCDREARKTEAHPILGDVPICNKCAAKVAALT